MKTQKSLSELRQIKNVALSLMGYSIPTNGRMVNIPSLIPEEKKDSKAYKKFERFFNKSIEKPLTKFDQMETDFRLDHALEVDGKIVRNAQGGYEYSKAGEKALVLALRGLEDHKIDVDYDLENESWDDLIALVPEDKRNRCSIEDPETQSVFLPFYQQTTKDESNENTTD